MKRSKRYTKAAAILESNTAQVLVDAIELLKKTATVKFSESVDVAIVLGIDATKSEQTVRGSCGLPHGTGKKIRVAVFADGELADQAKEAGASIVGTDSLAEEIKKGQLNFDLLIATPASMKIIGTLGQILGPRGLMPNPKLGTVTNDIAAAVKFALAGQVMFRNDKAGVIHAPIGKTDFTSDKIADNLNALLSEIRKLKPSSSKGLYLKRMFLSSTMGPSIPVDLVGLR